VGRFALERVTRPRSSPGPRYGTPSRSDRTLHSPDAIGIARLLQHARASALSATGSARAVKGLLAATLPLVFRYESLRGAARDARIRPESESARFVEWRHSPVLPRRCRCRVLARRGGGRPVFVGCIVMAAVLPCVRRAGRSG
jgi:hypothetical protein